MYTKTKLVAVALATAMTLSLAIPVVTSASKAVDNIKAKQAEQYKLAGLKL